MDSKSVALTVFFNNFESRLLHESSVSNINEELFFVAISKEKHLIPNPIVASFVINHQTLYPLTDLSLASLNFINNDADFEYIWLKKLNKKDPFFMKEMEMLRQNINNHLSVMWVGKPFDANSDFKNQADIHLFKLKEKIKNKVPEIGKKIKKLLIK